MSERALKALLGTVVGLFILWALVTYLPRTARGAGGEPEAVQAFFDGVTPESVTSVNLRSPREGESVALRRLEGEWKVNGFRADSANVARFWDALAEAEVGDLAASNPANHQRMGVTADSAWTFELEVAEGPRTLLVGKNGSRYGTAYVRLPGGDEVYLLEGNLRSQLTRPLDDWRNKRVATVDTTGVWRIEVERDDGGFVLERSDSLWVLEGGAPANEGTVRGILGEMARLDASGFYQASDSLAAPAGTLRALDQEGQPRLTLEIGSGEGDRWVRAAGDSITYRITSWRAGRIFPALESVAGEG